MRARNIKPGFFSNELLGTYEPIITLLFAGLWCLADKDGILEDRPLRIKAELFPYREGLDINGYITVMERDAFLTRYEVAGVKYIQINNFAKHQSPHHTEKAKGYPKPQEIQGLKCKPVLTPLNNGKQQVPTRSDSLIPDSLIPKEKPPVEKPQAAPPEVKKKSPITLRRFLEVCRERNELPIPEDDPIFNNAERENIPTDFLHLCWLEFRDQHLTIRGTKKQADWRATFRNCVRSNWYGLWYTSADGAVSLSSKGHAAQLRHREAA